MAEKAITWYNRLKEAINGQIKQNGKREITGVKLNSVLNQMVDALGKNMTFGGVVSPATVIDNTDDNPVFYLALEAGNYPYCGNIVVGQGQIAFLFRDANNIWFQASWNASDENFTEEEKTKLQGLPTQEELRDALGAKANAPESKPGRDNLASFDEDGNLKDSGVSIPVPTEEEKEHVLSSGETGLEWVPKPVDGKSALDIYNDLNPNARLNEAEFISKLQQKYPMKHAAYYSEAVSEPIGTPFPGALDGDELLPTTDTMGNLYIMPNSNTNPTGSIAFATINIGENEYAWVNLGAVDVPDNALTEEMVDNECSDGAINKPASAKVVMDLKAKLEGVTASETKINAVVGRNVTTDAYVSGETGLLVNNKPGFAYFELAIPPDTKNIRFATGTKTSGAKIGYSIGYYEENVYVPMRMFYFDVSGTTPPTGIVEKTIEVLEGETTFMATVEAVSTYASITLNDFYCYLQSGDSVLDEINKVDGKVAEINKSLSTFDEVTSYQTIQQSVYPTIVNDIPIWRNGGYYLLRKFELEGLDNKLCLYTDFITSANTDLLVWTSSENQEFPTGVGTDTYRPIQGFIKMEYPRSGSPYNNVELEIPDGAKFLYVAIYGTGTAYYRNAIINKAESRIENIEDDIEGLTQDISDITQDVDELQDYNDELFGTPEELTINGLENFYNYYGMSISQTGDAKLFTNYGSERVVHYVNLEGVKRVTIQPKSDVSCIFFIANQIIPKKTGYYTNQEVIDNFLVECEGYVKFIKTGETTERYYMRMGASSDPVTITLNDSAKYLYWQVHYSNTDSDLTPSLLELKKVERVGGIINEILERQDNNTGTPLKLVSESNKLYTTPIPLIKGVDISVKDGFKIYGYGYLVNHVSGKIVNDEFSCRENSRHRSNMCCLPGFDIAFLIESTDGGIVDNDEIIIDDFSLVKDLYTKRKPEGVSDDIYKAFLEKIQTFMGVAWTPKEQVSKCDKATNQFRKGVTYIGINYGGPTQFAKHVGIETSIRTYVTALANPRSVMYTEKVGGGGHKSSYGLSSFYEDGNSESGAYYACVCTGFTSYMLGLNSVVTSSRYQIRNGVDDSWSNDMFRLIMEGTTDSPNTIMCDSDSYSYSYDSVEDCQILAEKLQPMDFIWRQGHCAIISEIYVDEWGVTKYIVIAEQTVPTAVKTSYSPYYFFQRFKSNVVNDNKPWQILRKKADWTIDGVKIPRIGQDEEFAIMNDTQYNPANMGNIDPDITTFAGEYAPFVIGNYKNTTNNYKLFLNIHRGGAEGYTHIQIFNEDDDELTDPLEETLADNSTYVVKNKDIDSNSQSTDVYRVLNDDADGDWIVYNLANYWSTLQTNNTGKFKARVVRRESGTGTITENSGFTHFMMVEIEFEKKSDDKLYFIVNGGVPVQIRGERTDGIIADTSSYQVAISDLVEDTDYNVSENVYSGTGFIVPSFWKVSSLAYYRLVVKTDYGMASVRIAK